MRRPSTSPATILALLTTAAACGGETSLDGSTDASSERGTNAGAATGSLEGSADADDLDASTLEGSPNANGLEAGPLGACNSYAECQGNVFAAICCVDHVCTDTIPAECPDSAAHVAASNYDQSCNIDSDCVDVAEGNFCFPGCITECPATAINKRALPKYQADIANTPANLCDVGCQCPVIGFPCCRHGVCTQQCNDPSDTLPACADAGGHCDFDILSCGHPGPASSCAYSDETCCVY